MRLSPAAGHAEPSRRSDPPSPHRPRTSGRARVHPPSAPTKPCEGQALARTCGRQAGGTRGSRRRAEPRLCRRPSPETGPRGKEKADRAQPQPPSQVQPRLLPQGHAQTHSCSARGVAQSCATVPIPNLAVALSGRSAPVSRLPAPALSQRAAPAPCRSHTRETQTSC